MHPSARSADKPATQRAIAPDCHADAGPTSGDRGPRRILLVEDERAFRELLTDFLTGAGYAVHAAKDGQEAAAWLVRHGADVVITDLCMPDGDGMELVMKLRKRRPPVPVIAMSGGVAGQMAGMLRAAELMGARRTLSKPFPLQDLADAVAAALKPGA